jgi:polyphenol oxidase
MSTKPNVTRRGVLRALSQAGLFASVASAMPKWLRAAEPQDCQGPAEPAAVHYLPDGAPVLPRLAASNLNALDIGRLSAAYAALRQLTISHPADPRGWLQQGNKHCWNCGGGIDLVMGEEIHGSWLFLPWHRAYLYFHERILGSLIGDRTLRLAYWDWDLGAHAGPPPAWVTPNTAANPLWDGARSAVAGDAAPSSIVGPSILNPINGAADFDTFGGTATGPGILENGPHGAVHIWCGDTSQQTAAPDMGLLDTAAQDPIFFAHHTNIDRLWDKWVKSAATHTNPTNAAWLTHQFTFWDEQQRFVYITPADLINTASLSYTYDTVVPLPPSNLHVNADSPPEPSPPRPPNGPDPAPRSLARDSSGALQFSDGMRREILAARAETGAKLTLLRIEGVTLGAGEVGIFRLLANRRGVSAREIIGTPNDLGYVAIVPHNSRHLDHPTRPLIVELDVTLQLRALLRESSTVQLYYVGMAENEKSRPLKFIRAAIVQR